MRTRLTLGWLLVTSLLAATALAQTQPKPRLSLAEALALARRNNPDYLATLNDRLPAGRRLRSATASLLTPSVNLSGGMSYLGPGERTFSGLRFGIPAFVGSSWDLSLGYQFSGVTIADRAFARAQLDATEEDLNGARTLLETSVRRQYLQLLQAKAQHDLAGHVLARALEFLALAQARHNVGQATLIDVRQAEVTRGQAEVGLLRARQAVEVETLRLFQQLGVASPTPPAVELTDSFPVVQPAFELESLLAVALAENPTLRALRSRQTAARWGSRAAAWAYYPSLVVSGGWGGFTQDADTARQKSFPFDFTPVPFSVRAGISFPLYSNFGRSTRTAEARAVEDDLRQAVRARELALRAEVSATYLALVAAYQTIGLQVANRSAADEALELAAQRYRVGSGTFFELLDARVAAERASADYVTAVYDYHKAIAALENAVGRPLR